LKLLLDTHTFLWWLNDDSELGRETRRRVADPENFVYVSAATAWEIAVKRAGGKLDAPGSIADWIEQSGFVDLPIEVEHAVESADLPAHHHDPFDRLLVAQARLEGMTLVTSDAELDAYDVAIVDARR